MPHPKSLLALPHPKSLLPTVVKPLRSVLPGERDFEVVQMKIMEGI
jgi:hypothetical protein